MGIKRRMLRAAVQSAYTKAMDKVGSRVVAGMTIGTDMSILFTDIVNLMQSNDLELKKMVYLYTMKYAKSNPDLAILAINTFKKDTRDPNPLIRALAVRTMGCLHLEKIAEYLCDPLQRCLKDEDPYVKKTAAVCVAKLYVSLRLSFITLTHSNRWNAPTCVQVRNHTRACGDSGFCGYVERSRE